MSIRIEESACIGCGRCTEICPGNLLKLNERHRAEISAPEDCWGCTSCLKVCPAGAIACYLGLDMGGLGGTLKVRTEDGVSRWTVRKRDGSVCRIQVDGRDASRY